MKTYAQKEKHFKAKSGKQRFYSGLWAERWAELWLRLKGYQIIVRRYKTPVGEIDIVARRSQIIAIVEVKKRQKLSDAKGAIGRAQQQRLCNAARYLLSSFPQYSDFDIRFDALLINRYGRIEHIQNAWNALS